ncbi:MAG: hypothetical protein KF760_24440 [Candidatus Eremiobacteraeota bacterium]|nr:hypothetical protein [Candidatus Eremiobacteraeota bacterium]MCW5867529.1 hypothetical protein [Candidatus Eremiobacteraeota bacterium]
MFTSPISTSPSLAPPSVRKPASRPVENMAPLQPEVKTGIESLSLESKLDLSQKAQVQPPSPPQASKKKATVPERPPNKSVEGEDFTGRTCSGTLHGPLLMEDPAGLSFECENARDHETMTRLGLQLGQVPPELLHMPAGEAPVVQEPGFTYFGIQPEGAHLVQHVEEGPGQLEESRVKLPDGQTVLVTRGPNEISILVPPASLDELASWGRSLLAIG